MIRLIHIGRELGRNLYHHAGTSLASLLSLTLLFLLFDLFWIAAGTSDRFYQDLLSELRVELFLSEAVDDDRAFRISNQLVMTEGALDVEYISRDAARRRLTGLVGADLFVGYEDANPLPRSYIVTLKPDWLNSGDLKALATEWQSVSGIDQVAYSRQWLLKAEAAKSMLFQIGLALGLLIFATALVSSANGIRLMTRARAVGFRQMLLAGAGRLFVALPFLLESFLISGLAAVWGWALIFYGRGQIGFSRIEIVFPTIEDITIFCLMVAALGVLSGYLGLRKLLKD